MFQNLVSFINKDIHQEIVSSSLTIPNNEGRTLLVQLFGQVVNTDSQEHLPQIRSQMLVCSLERYDGEFLDKIKPFFNPSSQLSLLQILDFGSHRLSNNLLSFKAKENFVFWLREQKQNELLMLFLGNKMPTAHACATQILEYAVEIGDVDFLELLIDSGIDLSPLNGVYGGRKLVNAASIEIAQILLRNGAEINTPTCAQYPETALHYATMEGDAEMVQFLLKAGAEVETLSAYKEANNTNALGMALNSKSVELVRILVTAGANVDRCEINMRKYPVVEYWSAIKYSSYFVMMNCIRSC